MTNFIHNTACPQCQSRGNDRSGNNLGVWDDGHTFCWSCGFKEKAVMNIDTIKRRFAEATKLPNNELDVSDYTKDIPKVALNWLFKYGLNMDDVKIAQFMWNPRTESLVMPVFDGLKVVVTNERYFGKNPDYSKYITKGNKSLAIKMFVGPDTPRDRIVLTEDYVSAYKVAKCNICTMPLFGSSVDKNKLISLSKDFTSLLLWLDFNKAAESIREASKASQYFKGTCRSIITELDPKEYSYKEIVEKLK